MLQLIFISLVLCTGSPPAKRARLASSQVTQNDHAADDQLADLASTGWLESYLSEIEKDGVQRAVSDSTVGIAQEHTIQDPAANYSVTDNHSTAELQPMMQRESNAESNTSDDKSSDGAFSNDTLLKAFKAGIREAHYFQDSRSNNTPKITHTHQKNQSAAAENDYSDTTVFKHYKKFRGFIENCKDRALFKNFFNECIHKKYKNQIESNPSLIDFFYDVLKGKEPSKDCQFKAEGPETSLATSFDTILDFMEKGFVEPADSQKIIFSQICRELIKDATNKLMNDFELKEYRKNRTNNIDAMTKFAKDLTEEMSLQVKKIGKLETHKISKEIREISGRDCFLSLAENFRKICEIPKRSILARMYARVSLVSELAHHIRHAFFRYRMPRSTPNDIICFIVYSFLTYEKVNSFIDKVDRMNSNDRNQGIEN